jgi:hypothetical protein
VFISITGDNIVYTNATINEWRRWHETETNSNLQMNHQYYTEMVHPSASAKHFKLSQHWYILQIKYFKDNEWMDDHFVIGANTTINQSIFGKSHRSD